VVFCVTIIPSFCLGTGCDFVESSCVVVRVLSSGQEASHGQSPSGLLCSMLTVQPGRYCCGQCGWPADLTTTVTSRTLISTQTGLSLLRHCVNIATIKDPLIPLDIWASGLTQKTLNVYCLGHRYGSSAVIELRCWYVVCWDCCSDWCLLPRTTRLRGLVLNDMTQLSHVHIALASTAVRSLESV